MAVNVDNSGHRLFMILVVLLLLVALLLAIRASAAATESADHIRALQARLQTIETEVGRLTRGSSRSAASAAVSDATPVPGAPLVLPPPPAPDTPPPPVPPARAIPAPQRSLPASQPSTTLETEIGSRWMLLAGVVVLVLGVAFFVKYAVDRQWINETARVAIGTAAGLAVWTFGLRVARRGYVLFGRMVAGGGLAMMFVSAWAAVVLYGLVSTEIGFVWVVAVAVIAATTADRQRSVGLALVAVVFAYAAPFLLPSRADNHLVLFTYEAVLAVAALVLVRRHGWPALGLASWWATWTTLTMWMARFYRDTMFVSTEIYLVIVSSIFVAMIPIYRQRSADPMARLAAYALYAGPVFFHLASLYVLFDHPLWFLTYLIIVTAICVSVAADRSPIRLCGWCAVAWPFLVWIGPHRTAGWFVPAMVAAVAVYVLHFVPQLRAFRSIQPPDAPALAELVLFQFNGLGMFLFAYLLVDAHAGSTPLLAGSMAVWYLILAWKFRIGLPSMFPHALATAFTLGAVTIALALTGPWVTAAYAAEGAAMIVVGLKTRRWFFRFAGAALMVCAASRLVALQFGVTPVSFTPLVNSRTLTGAFIVALLYAVAWQYRQYRMPLGAEANQAIAVTIVMANLLTLGLLTADVNSFWIARPEQLTADFSRQLSVSVTWAAYAMGVIWIGFARQSATLRYLALALFGATVLKMFAVDLLELDGIYRITGFIALGLILLAASFLYQRHRPLASGS
jgi:uncharacterized membrane protein